MPHISSSSHDNMKAPSTFAAALVVAVAAAPLALAEDVRITCTGTVSSLGATGVAPAPFAFAQPGDVVTIIADAEIALQLPFGRYLYSLNVPTTSITVGNVSEALDPTGSAQVYFQNDAVQFGDYVAVNGQFANASGTSLQLLVSDPSGGTWSSDDILAVVGTTVQVSGLDSLVQVYGGSDVLNIDLQSVQFDAAPGSEFGTPYCTAAPNSSGSEGETIAFGLDGASDNDLSLTATNLPVGVLGYFLASQTQGFTPAAGGSSGNLCLGGSIGRFVGPGQVKSADFGGEIALAVDLTNVPTPVGSTAVQAGETWSFQLWHRDQGGAGSTSNFTRGVALTFQ